MSSNMSNSSFEEFGNTSSPLHPPSYCGIPDSINEQVRFWIEGVLLCVVGIIGFFGNATTFYVLSRIEGNCNIFNKLLMQLLFGDSICIVLVIVDFSLRKTFKVLTVYNSFYGSMWPKLIYPFIKISYTWIMCCQIAITIER